MGGIGEVDRPVRLGQPHLHLVGEQDRGEVEELGAGERQFRLAHDDCVEPPVQVGESIQKAGRLRATGPGQTAGAAHVEELRDDPTPFGDHIVCAVALPATRGVGVLILHC
jgi:hypothetical protein